MRKCIFISFLILFASIVDAQMTNSSDAKELKMKKVIVALREYPKNVKADEKAMIDSVNTSLKFAIENYWNFNSVADYMPLSKAKDFVKKNKKTHCFITIDKGVSKSLKHGSSSYRYQYVSYSEKLSVYTPSLTASVYLPQYSGSMNKTTSVYSVMQLQKILDLLYQKEFKNIIGSLGYVKKNGPKIIKKTLLIPKEYVSPKLSVDDIKLAYPYDLDICDLDKIKRATLNKDPKYAIIVYVPIPVGGKMVHRLYVSNAEDGDVYGVADGSKVDIDLGIFGNVGGQKKKYLINEKELKQLSKLVD